MKPLIVAQDSLLHPLLSHDVMGFELGKDFLSFFEIVSLKRGTYWIASEAQFGAELIRESLRASGRPVLLLGSKVCKAFGIAFEPFTHGAFAFGRVACGVPFSMWSPFAILPHPSSNTEYWNRLGAYDRARTALLKARVLKEYPPRGEEKKGERL